MTGGPAGYRLAFLAPRFHSNQFPALAGLVERGCELAFLEIKDSAERDDQPFASQRVPLWNAVDRMARMLVPDSLWSSLWRCPSPIAVGRILSAFRPDAVVIREPFALAGAVQLAACASLALPVVIYTQTAQRHSGHVPASLRLFHLLFARLLRIPWYTPVRGPQDGRRLGGVTWIPFACVPAPDIAARPPADPPRILCIGKLVPRKNHLFLLRALARLPHRRFHLTIAGACLSEPDSQHLSEVEAEVGRLGLSAQVDILVNLRYQAALALYARHDLFVLPSTREPASISNLEAMAYGLPVILSDGNGTACCTRPGIDGWLFRDGDEAHLSCVLADALSDAGRLQRMGAAALAAARGRFSQATFHARLLALLRQARIRPRGTGP